MYHSMEKPCLQRLVNFSFQDLQLLPSLKASINFASNILN